MRYSYMTPVNYACECGDETLPLLSELVSAVPDIKKDIILDYLRTNCVAASSGLRRDLLNPEEIAGCGNLYSDDKYIWDDCLAYYIAMYNIPLPQAFREHILQHHIKRKKRHLESNLLEYIIIHNNPCHGHYYEIEINQSGLVSYKNNSNNHDKSVFLINKQDAGWIVHEIVRQTYCYDIEDRGNIVIDGYYWTIEFYNKNGLSYKTQGATGEPDWRFRELKYNLEFIERCTGKNMGSNEMETKD